MVRPADFPEEVAASGGDRGATRKPYSWGFPAAHLQDLQRRQSI